MFADANANLKPCIEWRKHVFLKPLVLVLTVAFFKFTPINYNAYINNIVQLLYTISFDCSRNIISALSENIRCNGFVVT